MLCDHRRQQHSWFGCRVGSDVSLSIFATESSMTSQLKRRNDVHLLLWKFAKVGSSKPSTNDFIRVSPNSSVTDVTKTLHSWCLCFLLKSKNAAMERATKVRICQNQIYSTCWWSSVTVNCTVFYMVEIKALFTRHKLIRVEPGFDPG